MRNVPIYLDLLSNIFTLKIFIRDSNKLLLHAITISSRFLPKPIPTCAKVLPRRVIANCCSLMFLHFLIFFKYYKTIPVKSCQLIKSLSSLLSSYSYGHITRSVFVTFIDLSRYDTKAILIERSNKAATTISQNEIGLKYDKQRDLKYFGLIIGQILDIVSNIGEVIIL